jgi:hypothetical protein
MPLGSGLAAQLGFAEEITFSTYVVPARFHEFVQEKVNLKIDRIEARGLRAGQRVLRSSQWAPGKQTADGDVELEVWNKSHGLWLKHAFGTVALSQPDAGGNPTVWDQTFTPGDLTGKSLSVQFGRPDQSGTVRPFSYKGTKIAKWKLGAKVGELLKLTLTLMAQAEDTSQGLAAASYPTGVQLFTFTQGTLTLGGIGVDVKEAVLNGDNMLSADRYKLGTALRKEPLEAGTRKYDGNLACYFPDLSLYNRFTGGTEATLVLDFLGALISGTFSYEVKVTANVRFDGDTPNVSGPAEIEQPLPIKCVDPGTGAITVLYRSTDTAP